MPHRDDGEASRARAEALARELEEVAGGARPRHGARQLLMTKTRLRGRGLHLVTRTLKLGSAA